MAKSDGIFGNCCSCTSVYCVRTAKVRIHIERFGESKREKPFVHTRKKKLYTTFSESFSYPLSGVLNILWCKFSTDPLYIYIIFYNIYIYIYIFSYMGVCKSVCLCVCVYLRYIYKIYTAVCRFFSTSFFFLSLQEKSLRVRERVKIKIKGTRKKK